MTSFNGNRYPAHHWAELALWVSTWTFGVGYSVYNCFVASQAHVSRLRMDLDEGWIGGRLKDNTDYEWQVFSGTLMQSIPWLAIHLVGSQCLKRLKQQKCALPVFNVILSMLYLRPLIGTKALVYLLLQPCVFMVVMPIASTVVVWSLAVAILATWTVSPMAELREWFIGDLDQHAYFVVSVTMSWVNSRCVSFCLDHAWGQVPPERSVGRRAVLLLAYCFYLPLAIGGPLVSYQDFRAGMEAEYRDWTVDRMLTMLSMLIRYAFWFAFAEVLLHFFYFSALQSDMSIMNSLDLWTLSGVGFSMGQFFHLKYVVFYGFPRAFLLSDGVAAPPHPKCVSRIHLYSDMWRYFDFGLYTFMHKYIYAPFLRGRQRGNVLVKVAASLAAFGFVYVWHGTQTHVLTWSVLNFMGIMLEMLARHAASSAFYRRLEMRLAGSQEGVRRLHAIISSPLFLMSILSSFYFFMGSLVGDLFMSRALTSWPLGTPLTLLFMTAGAQVSIEVKNWETRSMLRSNKESAPS